MTRLLIVWHSRTGGTGAMIQAAAEGARTETAASVIWVESVEVQDLLEADGFIFAAPENLGGLSGAMKEFFDRMYYPVLGRIEGRPYAQMICAGSDGSGAARQVARIATGWRLREVQPPLIVCTHAQTAEDILAPKTIGADDLARCRDLGQAMGAGLAAGIF